MPRTDAEPAGPKPRGRPRSAAADDAIQVAALEVIVEVGFKVATLEMIAARAGVGTATIYRRYPTKRDLFGAALRAAAGDFVAPRTGNVVDDLAILIHQVSAGVRSKPLGRLFAAISFAEPDLFELGWEALGQPRRAVLQEVVEAAVVDGQLRPDLDVELFLDALSAVPVWTQIVRPGTDFTVESARATVRLLLAGAGSAHATKEGTA